MSNETDNAARSPPRASHSPIATFQILKDNFAVVSGLAVVGGVGLGTIFLYTYLSVFGWHLIWFVQYADILTFGLVAVGVIGGSLIFLQAVTQTFLDISGFSAKAKRWWLAISGLALLGLLPSTLMRRFASEKDIFTFYLVR